MKPMRIFVLTLIVSVLSLLDTFAQTTLDLSFSLADVHFRQQNGFDIIEMKGARSFAERPGEPQLPMVSVIVPLPSGMQAYQVHLLETEQTELPGTFNLYPFQGYHTTEQQQTWVPPDPGVYASASLMPANIIRLSSSGSMSGVAVATVVISPFQYTPSTGKLIFHSRIRFSIEYRSAATALNPIRRQEKSIEIFKKILTGAIDKSSFDPSTKALLSSNISASLTRTRIEPAVQPKGFVPKNTPSLEGSGVDYLIITNDEMAEAFQELATWKTKKGIPAVVKTISWIKANYVNGLDDAETIRNFIRVAYENWGVTYVLLGGDVGVISHRRPPMPYWVEDYGYIPTDLYYATLDGNWNANGNSLFGEVEDEIDLYPDVFIGRAPVITPEQAALFVTKTMQYEQGGVDDFYRDRMLFIGENLWGYNDGEWFCEQIDSVSPRMIDTKIYQNRVGNDWNRQTILNAFNSGYNLIYSQNHSNAYHLNYQLLHRNDMDNLSNGRKYSIWYMIGCYANNIELECISKRFMLAPNGGGVAYIGSTGNDWPYLTIDVGLPFFSALNSQSYNHIAPLLSQARMELLPYVVYGGPFRAMYLSYTLLGDPELPISIVKDDGYARQILADHSEGIQIGSTTFQVSNVREPSWEVPGTHRILANARVTLFKDNEVLATELTDDQGNAYFSGLRPHTEGEMSIVITAPNHLPYMRTIPVERIDSPHGYFVSFRVDDDNEGNSRGNRDGVINPGEIIELRLSLANSGGRDAENVKIVANTSSTFINLIKKETTIRYLPTGNVPTEADDDIIFEVSSGSPDRSRIIFQLQIEYGGGLNNTDEFEIEVKAPQLLHTTTALYDLRGNAVRWENAPKGEYDLKLGIQNIGSGRVTGIYAYFVDNTGRLTVYNPTVFIGDLNPSEEGTAIYRCHYHYLPERIGRDDGKTHQIKPLHLERNTSFLQLYNENGVLLEHSFRWGDVGVPTQLTHKPHANSITVRWNHVSAAAGYEIFRDGRKISKYLISSGSVFEDLELQPNAVHEYTVRAVDRESNESVHSIQYRAWTQLASNSGWPKRTNNAVVGSPAVDDIDRDGRLEVFASSHGKIFGWRYDGSPLGNNPDGILADLGSSNGIWSQAVIVDLNNDGVKELIVTVRGDWQNTHGRLYVWSIASNGVLTLWQNFPRIFDFRILARPAVGDITGDGVPEIAVITEDLNGSGLGGLFVVGLDGNFLPGFGFGELRWIPPDKPYASYAEPVIGDIDGDGRNELVIGARGVGIPYKFYAFRGNGQLVSGWPVDVPANMQIHYHPVLSDIDSDGIPELVGVAHDHSQQTGYNGKLFVYKGDGSSLAGWEEGKDVPLLGFLISAPLVTHLFDGYGQIFLNTSSGPAGWHYDGSEIEGWALSGSHPALPHPTGVGMIAARVDERDVAIIVPGLKALYAFHLNDASPVAGWPVTSIDGFYFAPIVADVDNDGTTDVLLGSLDGYVYSWRTNSSGSSRIVLGGDTQQESLPIKYSLMQNYPNPFNPTTNIRYELPERTLVSLKIYNVLGQEVANLVHEIHDAGRYEIEWNANKFASGVSSKGGYASGVYFYRMTAGNFIATKKLLLLK